MGGVYFPGVSAVVREIARVTDVDESDIKN